MAPHGGLCSRFRARTFVRAHGRLAISISTRPTRSVSADGCRKSGWLTTASCRLSDGRVQDVWSVTVYVRSVLVTSTVGLSMRCTRFRCPSSLTQSSARPAKQEEPSGKKISIGSENRWRCSERYQDSVMTR